MLEKTILPNARLPHRLQQVKRADDVVAVIQVGLLDRFADEGEGGKVHHGVDFALAQQGRQLGLVAQVAFDQQAARHGLAMALRQVVVDHDLVAGRQQPAEAVRADVTGAAGDENPHSSSSFATIDRSQSLTAAASG